MTHERHLKLSALTAAPMPAATVDANADLESVLAAWHGATVRLEQTHKTLREEVARLTTELKRKNQELARKNRLADLGQMASHVAHEVRNNLVPVALYVSLLRRRLADNDACLKVVEQIESGIAALDVTVNDLLHFTSDREPQWEPVPLRRLVEDVLGSLSPQLHAQAIEITIDVPKEMIVSADRDMLRRALLNLVLNAVDAMPSGGELVVTACQGPSGVELEVADSGSGLDGDRIATCLRALLHDQARRHGPRPGHRLPSGRSPRRGRDRDELSRKAAPPLRCGFPVRRWRWPHESIRSPSPNATTSGPCCRQMRNQIAGAVRGGGR